MGWIVASVVKSDSTRRFAMKALGGKKEKGKLGPYAMKRVAGGAHLPTPWLFEHAKRPDDRDYCLDCSFLLVQALGIRFYS